MPVPDEVSRLAASGLHVDDVAEPDDDGYLVDHQPVIDTFLTRENERLRAERDQARALVRSVAAAHPEVMAGLMVLSDKAEYCWLDEQA